VTARHIAEGVALEKVEPILLRFHEQVQAREREALDGKGSARLTEPFGTDDLIDAAVEEIRSLAPDHYTAERVDYLKTVIRQHFEINAEIERSWFADRANDATAKAYRVARMNHGVHWAWAHVYKKRRR
jgi:hypothetical protein